MSGDTLTTLLGAFLVVGMIVMLTVTAVLAYETWWNKWK
jgi:hypothetical protein